MRILIATCHQSVVGGIEKYLQVLIPALLNRGHQVALLYEHAAPAGAEVVEPSADALPVWYWQGGTQLSPLLEDLEQWRPDVVYSNGLDSLDLENTLLAAGPTVFYAHVYHGTCATGRKCHDLPRREPCQRTFGPMCLALHYPRRCGGLNPLRAWQSYQKQAGHNRRLADYQSILVASSHMRREFEQHGVSQEKLHLVPLPTTDARLEPTERTTNSLPHSILFVGRLTSMKGVDYLLDAIPLAEQKLGRRLTLTIAGDGGERLRLEQQAVKAGLDARFTGWVESEAKMEAMRQADLLAVPSLWPEPFGLVGIEAGCCALPAVGYAVGGIPDWLISGQTGEIAPGHPPTVHGLADAIVRALRDPDHYRRLSRGAWELSRKFTLERHLAQLEGVLQAACAPSQSMFPSAGERFDRPAVTAAERIT